MPSSLATLLPPALGFSPRPPASVFGTGPRRAIAAFLGGRSARFATPFRSRRRGASRARASRAPAPSPSAGLSIRRHAPRARVPACSVGAGHRTLRLSSIGCASRPPLRPRLPRGRSASPRNPWTFGPEDSHLRLATHSGILPSYASTAPRGCGFPGPKNAPLPPPGASPRRPAASAARFSPGHFRRGAPRPVSCYALFQRLAASGPTSWLSSEPHILSHLTRTLGP